MEENYCRHMMHRETFFGYNRSFQRKNHVNNHLIQNLQQECILEGHTGCVNCLDWNSDGSLLASGSDDTSVILWDAYQHKNIQEINTQHHGNIFSIKFIPCTGDHVIATGAADGHILLHDLIAKETICAYSVDGRIKRLVASKAEPNMLISASEDGTIREYDIRQRSPTGGRVLVNLTAECGDNAECKCVAINPTNPHCIAVGSNDQYVRMYDRRMFDMHKHGIYFTPGHLYSKQSESKKGPKNICVTYLTFNPRGNEILVNMGGEQIYIFDIFERAKPIILDVKIKSSSNGVKKHPSNGLTAAACSDMGINSKSCNDSEPCSRVEPTDGKSSTIPQKVVKPCEFSDSFRLKGNALFSDKKYASAVQMYNKALLLSPKSVIYSNRAAALIKRQWEGDYYAALKDCYLALRINPSDVKAHYRLARCMFELKWLDEARSCMKEFKINHPDHSNSNACLALEKEINSAIKSKGHGHGKKSKMAHVTLSPDEISQRETCFDYKYRYCGHCNTTTDIKEANFFGENGQYIVAGSDEGSFFIWERSTTNLIRIMQGDSSIVNCVQPHPTSCMLATSGIDPVVKIWSPMINDSNQKHVVMDIDSVSSENQKRMNNDPLESMLMSMGMHLVPGNQENQSSEVMPCRPT